MSKKKRARKKDKPQPGAAVDRLPKLVNSSEYLVIADPDLVPLVRAICEKEGRSFTLLF